MAALSLLHRLFLAVALMWAVPLHAADEAALDALHEVMRTDEMIRILSDEGIADAEGLQEDMFPGRGGPGWPRMLRVIYAPSDMTARFREAFDREMQGTDVAALLDYYRSDAGVRVTSAEVDSRRAISSDEVEAAAGLAFETLATANPARLAMLEEFVDLNDLVERNVAGAMTSSLAFFRGLADGGGFEMGKEEMLAQVWEQETEIRADTEGWVFAYLTLAYGQLSDDELRAYTDLSATGPGRDLNRALFAGFYEAFQGISFDLGRAASSFMVGEDL